ncbi:MAG: MmcB family DNA repair protein [Bacteroides sp.]|nr:MmcB family DNA repair protein [Bacteroides sp.]
MNKSKLTVEIEKALVRKTKKKKGLYGALEATIGFSDKGRDYERCDYMTFDSSNEICCYEIKVSKEDLQSQAKKTFIGNRNYLVIDRYTYDELKENHPELLPKGMVGIMVYDIASHKLTVKKRCSLHSMNISTKVQCLEAIARAGCRDAAKYYLTGEI